MSRNKIPKKKKLYSKNSQGLSIRAKLCMQFFFGFLISVLIICVTNSYKTTLFIPLVKNLKLDLGIFYLIFSTFVIIFFSNAVNFADGLDGLAIVPIIVSFISIILITFFISNKEFADFLHIDYISNVEEIIILCGSVVGACLGFLWYNALPAKIFMGDVGSLPLGALLGSISVIIKYEFLLFIICGFFVLEIISVILQIVYFKLYKKRLFKMAPIHHHFEMMGWNESVIVVRFWIISIIFAFVGFFFFFFSKK